MELIDVVLLLFVAWIFGRVFKYIQLPEIFGQLAAGLIIGPTLLGIIHPNETITLLSELGIFFLMFHAGLETEPHKFFKYLKFSIWPALGGIVIPFVLGYFVAHSFGHSVSTSLYIAMGLSVTAIAVTAKIFKDYKIQDTTLAHVVMGAALFDDIFALILLSVILELVQTGGISLIATLILVFKVLIFFGGASLIGHYLFPFLHRVVYRGNKGFTFTLIVAMGFGLLAELFGLHIIIGAYIAGLFIREETLDGAIYEKIEDRVYGIAYSFLGPIFFASLAFHLDFIALREDFWFLIAVIGVALVGKHYGAGLLAKYTGADKDEWPIVGMAMNGRGAVELLIASIGLAQGVIDERVFSVLVIMAFVTTVFSSLAIQPYIQRYRRNRQVSHDLS